MHQVESAGRLLSIQISQPRTFTDAEGEWTSAIGELPVSGVAVVGYPGIEGDGVANTKHHGGVDKAVLAYSADHYTDWNDLTPAELPFGAFGENLSIAGVDETGVCIGDQWKIGAVVFEVSQPRNPCWKLGRRWRWPQLPKLVTKNGRSGWYLRVKQTGAFSAEEEVTLLTRQHADWSVARAFRVFYYGSPREKQELAELPELSDAWKHDLTK